MTQKKLFLILFLFPLNLYSKESTLTGNSDFFVYTAYDKETISQLQYASALNPKEKIELPFSMICFKDFLGATPNSRVCSVATKKNCDDLLKRISEIKNIEQLNGVTALGIFSNPHHRQNLHGQFDHLRGPDDRLDIYGLYLMEAGTLIDMPEGEYFLLSENSLSSKYRYDSILKKIEDIKEKIKSVPMGELEKNENLKKMKKLQDGIDKEYELVRDSYFESCKTIANIDVGATYNKIKADLSGIKVEKETTTSSKDPENQKSLVSKPFAGRRGATKKIQKGFGKK